MVSWSQGGPEVQRIRRAGELADIPVLTTVENGRRYPEKRAELQSRLCELLPFRAARAAIATDITITFGPLNAPHHANTGLDSTSASSGGAWGDGSVLPSLVAGRVAIHTLPLMPWAFCADFREANRPYTRERRAPVFSVISRPAARPV
jgi:hypothetical protein